MQRTIDATPEQLQQADEAVDALCGTLAQDQARIQALVDSGALAPETGDGAEAPRVLPDPFTGELTAFEPFELLDVRLGDECEPTPDDVDPDYEARLDETDQRGSHAFGWGVDYQPRGHGAYGDDPDDQGPRSTEPATDWRNDPDYSPF